MFNDALTKAFHRDLFGQFLRLLRGHISYKNRDLYDFQTDISKLIRNKNHILIAYQLIMFRILVKYIYALAI